MILILLLLPVWPDLLLLLPVWPDLAKFRHFGKFFMVDFLFAKMLSLNWRICYIIGLNFIVTNGQILQNNLTIWSHWAYYPAHFFCISLYSFLIIEVCEYFSPMRNYFSEPTRKQARLENLSNGRKKTGKMSILFSSQQRLSRCSHNVIKRF